MMRLLIADDERELANALGAILKHSHYSVDIVYDGADALDWALTENYDGIILDIMMPKMNGIEVLRTLREKHISTPVILLTAKNEIEDKIEGLDSGADDYLSKPFAMGELLARVRSITRRSGEVSVNNTLTFADLSLEITSFTLRCGSSSVRLGNKEFQMIQMLMKNPQRLVSTEQFMERIWGYDSEAEINVVWVYISYLRKKLSSLGSRVEIKAQRGTGYSLEERHD